MNMKSTSFLMAALVVGTLWASHATVCAQPTNLPTLSTNTPPPNHPPLGAPMHRMTGLEHLGLTPEQLDKARPIAEDMQKQLVETYRNQTLDIPAKQAKSKEIREATVAKLKPILSPEQLTRWQQLTASPARRLPPSLQAAPATPVAPVNASTNAPQK
jgi:hypothetical protein